MPASNIFQNFAQGQQMANQRELQEQQKQQNFMNLNEQRKGALFQDARVINSYLKSGNPQQAMGVIQNRLSLLDGEGDPSDTMEIAGLVASGNHQGAMELLDAVELAGVRGGFLQDLTPKAQKPFKTAEQLERELRVDEGSLALRRDELNQRQAESGKTKLSAKAEKAIIDSQDAFFKSGESARKMELLADDFNRLSVGGGLASSVTESFKDILGSQDEVTAARKRFNAIRSSQATSNLPPGPASDKDIALALSGFPKENANASQVIGFLRGQAKLARIDEKFNEFKAGFISNNNSVRGLIPAWKNQLGKEGFLDSILAPQDEIKEIQQPTTVGRFQIEVQ